MSTITHTIRRLSTAFLPAARPFPAKLVALLCCCAPTLVPAEEPALKRTQTVSLSAGWNAVFLEVEPLNVAPEKVFENLPVDIAASYFPHESPTQFVTNPGTQLFKGLGWGVWYAENRPDAFLKTLNSIYGNQAYLIHTTRAFEWRVEGLVSGGGVRWQPNSFNFTGFGVKKQGAPSFAEFFEASPSHRGQAIYRLEQNVWRKVLQPSAEAMRSGEAFWIFCRGGSDYQGPFTVETGTADGMLTLEGTGTASLVLRNHTTHPVTPHMEHLPTAAATLPLSIQVRVLNASLEQPIQYAAAKKPAQAWEQEMPALESGGRLALPFTARTAEMTESEQASLLRFTTDMGTETWVPVLGRRADLEKK